MIPLRDAVDVSSLGGKGVALGEALRAGLPVPEGYALAASWVDRLVSGDTNALEELRGMVPMLRTRVAVRSSAVGEDSAGASFAGQHATVLDVEPRIESIVEAVREVWASGRTDSALAYRRKLGIAGAPQVGIVIQRMVAPSSAGVLFSRDPLSGEDVRVIEAAWGLGEAVVAGLVTPDRFRVTRTGVVIERTAGYKDLLIQRAAGGGTEQVELDDDRARALCLTDAQLLALNHLAEQCERVYGGEQDLEWAFDSDDLFLLQRRPITVARASR